MSIEDFRGTNLKLKTFTKLLQDLVLKFVPRKSSMDPENSSNLELPFHEPVKRGATAPHYGGVCDQEEGLDPKPRCLIRGYHAVSMPHCLPANSRSEAKAESGCGVLPAPARETTRQPTTVLRLHLWPTAWWSVALDDTLGVGFRTWFKRWPSRWSNSQTPHYRVTSLIRGCAGAGVAIAIPAAGARQVPQV